MHANIDFVTPELAIGGDLDADERIARHQVADLVAAGITHIIDCRLEWSDEDLVGELAPEIVYLHNGVDDHGGTLADSFFERGSRFAATAAEDPDHKVLAHCHMGINRGPSMGLAIMLEAGWDPVDALTQIRTERPIAGILYSDHAVDWHLRHTGHPDTHRAAERRRVERWHDENWIDVPRIIRQIRSTESDLAS